MIDIYNDEGYSVDAERLAAAARAALAQQGADPASALSIVLLPDDAVAALNRQYRGIDAPTDVLSFPADALPDELRDDEAAAYLGDLVIAYPYTQAQAAREGHPLPDLLALLVVHGTLHLLGHDHDTPDSRARMWAAQGAALQQLAISPEIVPDFEDETDDH